MIYQITRSHSRYIVFGKGRRITRAHYGGSVMDWDKYEVLVQTYDWEVAVSERQLFQEHSLYSEVFIVEYCPILELESKETTLAVFKLSPYEFDEFKKHKASTKSRVRFYTTNKEYVHDLATDIDDQGYMIIKKDNMPADAQYVEPILEINGKLIQHRQLFRIHWK